MRHVPLFYPDSSAWQQADRRNVLLFGMSGLGKTYLSSLLREAGGWFHYSVDYRIGTRYMGELITDSFKREAMQVPYLAQLLRTDSIYIASNITFENLAPLSMYLGKPGDPDRGGLPIEDYQARQAAHTEAEVASLRDTSRFIDRAQEIYGYSNFVCDSGGSICEVVDPEDPQDPVLTALAESMLMIWIEGTPAHRDELVRRFDKAPKPMCYQPAFLAQCWTDYLSENNVSADNIDPDDFVRSTYARALDHRQPRYAAMARNWGISVTADEAQTVQDEAGFVNLIARALERAT